MSNFSSKMNPQELQEYLDSYVEEDEVLIDVPPPPPIPEVLNKAQTTAKRTLSKATPLQLINEKKREIVLAGETIYLTVEVSRIEKQLIIAHLTVDNHNELQHIKTRIYDIVTQFLMRYIPRRVMSTFRETPSAFIKHPGFKYTSSAYYGRKSVMIYPSVPDMFINPTAAELIAAKGTGIMYSLDNNIDKLSTATRNLYLLEAKLAKKIARCKTVLDLLELGVEYYDAYKIITR